VSLIDLMPTFAAIAGADAGRPSGTDLTPLLAAHAAPDADAVGGVGVDFGPLTDSGAAPDSVQEEVFFFYDDHKAGTAFTDTVPAPNRIRCIRERRWKYAVYFDPTGAVAPEFELYDLDADPDERRNLVDHRTGEAADAALRDERRRLHDALLAKAREHGALPDLARL
jgi:arylsulfatase A-like enzyme